MHKCASRYNAILLSLLLAVGATSCSARQPIQSSQLISTYLETNWKVSEQSLFDGNSIWVDMPTNNVTQGDRYVQYDCFYNDKESKIYIFPLSSFTYSGGAIDSDESVYLAKDAIEKSQWAIEMYLGKGLGKDIELSIDTIEEKEVNTITYSDVTLTMTIDGTDEKFHGVWVNNDGKSSTLWVSTDKELLSMIFSTIRRYTV